MQRSIKIRIKARNIKWSSIKKFSIYKLKDLLKLRNIIQKVYKTRSQKTPMKEPHKSKSQVNKKKERYKIDSNLFQDSPHPDAASCDNQSVELR